MQAAIGKTAQGIVILRSHVQIGVSDAIRSGDEREFARKVEELVAVIGRYRRTRAVIASGARS